MSNSTAASFWYTDSHDELLLPLDFDLPCDTTVTVPSRLNRNASFPPEYSILARLDLLDLLDLVSSPSVLVPFPKHLAFASCCLLRYDSSPADNQRSVVERVRTLASPKLGSHEALTGEVASGEDEMGGK